MKSPGGQKGVYGSLFRTDSKGFLGILLPFLLGVGILAFLTEFFQFLMPTDWARFAITVVLFICTVVCWTCKRFNFPFLSFYRWFTPLMLLAWSMALKLSMMEDVIFQTTGHLRVVGIAAGLLTAVILFRRIKKQEDKPQPILCILFSLLMGFLAFGFSFGGLLEINVLADQRTPQLTTTQVLQLEWKYRRPDPRVHGGKLYFAVVGENDLTETRRFPISKMDYDSLEPGDEVRLILHPGALGAPWLECVPNVD